MTKAELISAVQGNTGRTDKDDVIGIGLNLGLIEIYQRCAIKANRVIQVLGLSNGDQFVEMSRILGWNDMCLVVSAFIQWAGTRTKFPIKTKKQAIKFYQDYLQGGIPEFGYLESERIYLVPLATSTEDSLVTDYADCEDVTEWGIVSGITIANEWVDFKVGTKSMKISIGSSFAGGAAVASTDFSAVVDASDAKYIAVWLRSTIDVAANLIEIVLSDQDSGEKAGTYVTCPVDKALKAGEWTRVEIVPTTGSFSLLSSALSWGIYIDSAVGEGEILIDDIRLVRDEIGENNMSLEITADLVTKSFVLDTTENPVPGGDLTLINFATQYLFRNIGSIGRANDFYQQYQIALRSLCKYQAKTHTDISYNFADLLNHRHRRQDIILLSQPE